mgnify:CR=1 FL=1|jgi:hypothetical protein
MTRNIVPNKALTLGAPALLHAHRNRDVLKKAITKFAQQRARESTHHIILATHRPMTMHEARYLLKEWDKLMNGQILGGRWNRKPHLHCEWVAFPEHIHSDPHWHLLWRMSRDLEEATVRKIVNGRLIDGPKYGGRIKGQLVHGLDWIVHSHWQRAVSSGTSKVVQIGEPERLGTYVTKGQRDAVAFDNIVTSGEFKTCLPKAA